MSTDIYAGALAGLFTHLTPEITLAAAACLLFLGGSFRTQRALWGTVTLTALALAGVLLFYGPTPLPAGNPGDLATYGTPFVFDPLTLLIRWIALGAGVLLTLFGWSEVPERQSSDFFACLLVIVAGTSLTAASNDLVVLFLGLEMVSIPTYVLLYLPRNDEAAQEAAMKYFFISIFSSAILLFGFSYLYGIAGTTNLPALLNALNGTATKDVPLISQIALVMVVAGLGFRITAVPFHFYAPDVYQGTATVGAALLAVIPKIVGFVALVRVLGFVLPYGLMPRADTVVGIGLSENLPVLLWFLAVVTMSIGNLLALVQNNFKRLMAYSSIAHSGYMLMALATTPFLAGDNQSYEGPSALFYYLIAYGVMSIGIFALISYFETSPALTRDRSGKDSSSVEDLAGLGTTHPALALMTAIFLFSMIGIPLTAGFAGKFLIFFGAMTVPWPDHAVLFRVLAVIGVLNAAIGGWYYLRVVAIMYLRPAVEPLKGRKTWPGLALLTLCAVLTIGLGVPPAADWLAHSTREATQTLRYPHVEPRP